MFKILNRNREVVGLITSPINPIIEDNLTGMNELKFSVPATQEGLELEGYIRIENEHEYVIKEISTHGHNREVIAIMNVEELIGKVWTTFRSVDTYPTACIREIVAGTGWTVVDNCPPNKKRNLYGTQTSSWDLIFLACDVWGIEVKFDTHNKVITTQEKGGTDRGTYFMSDLNLKQLMHDSHTHKLITRVIPIGKDGLTIEKVNNGKNYIENHSYSNKVITGIWQSDRYTKAQDLMDDAREYLAEMCVPYESYECKVSDLYRLEKNPNFEFNVGDVIYLIDNITKKKIQQRIIKHTKNLTAPDKDTINLANKSMSFTDYYKRLQLISNMTEQAIGSDGLISSGSIESVEADKITGEITASNVKTNTIVSEHIKADQILAGHIKADQIYGEHIVSDEIDTRHLKADSIKAEHISAGEIDADHISAESIQSGHISTGAIHAGHVQAGSISSNHIQTNTISSGHLQAGSVDAGHIKAGSISSNHLSSQSISSDHIQTNSVKAEHIQSGSIQTGHIQTGAITAGSGIIADGAIGSAQISSLDANKINAGEIDTSKVKIKGENGFLFIENNTLYVVDNNKKIRCELGVIENNSNYGFIVRGADGQTIMLDHNGVHNAGITDGAIDNRKVSENANISGKKLDIDSVVRSINEDGSVTLQGTKVQIGNTTLDVKLSEQNNLITEHGQRLATQQSEITANTNAIKLKVDNQTYTADKNEINTKLNKATSDISVMQGQISLKVEQTDIENAVDELEGAVDQKIKDAKAEIKVTTDSISQRVSSNESTTSALSTKVTTIEGTANTANSKVDNLQVGGTNLWVLSDLQAGYEDGGGIINSTACHQTRKTIIDISDCISIVYQVWNPNKVVNLSNTNRVAFFDNEKTLISSIMLPKLNGDTYQTTTITKPTNAVYARLGAITGASSQDADIKIKFEKGNKPTDYTPAPEDVQGNIDTAQTTANSANTLANTANNTANTNKTNITTLQNTVTTTNNKVAELTTSLDSITQRVSSNETTTSTLSTTVESVKTTANNANTNASNALDKANTANTNASNAVTTANEANTTASTASTNATTALNTANSAKDTASSASTKADNAVSTANTAKTTADNANTLATTANNTANTNKNNITTLQSTITTTNNKVAELTTSLDGITQRVQSTESSIQNTNSMLSEVSTGVNKVLFEMYSKTGQDGTEIVTIDDYLDATLLHTLLLDDFQMFGGADEYLGKMTTHLYFNQNVTHEVLAYADDGSSIYLNGTLVASIPNCIVTPVTLNFKQGWNKIVWVYNEGNGEDGCVFEPSIKTLGGLVHMNAYPVNGDIEGLQAINSSVRTTNNRVAEIVTSLDGITQRVSSNESTTSTLTSQMNAVDGKINSAKNDAIYESSGIKDTRNDNQNPEWYMTHYGNRTVDEFKLSSVVGVPTESYFGIVTTKVPWADASGGLPVQTYTSHGSPTYERSGTSLHTWGEWVQVEDAQGSQAKANQALNDAKAFTTTEVTKTNNKVAEIVTNLDSITSRVSATETLAETTKEEFSNAIDTSVGNRKWLFEKYTNTQLVGTGNGTYPTLEHLRNETLTSSELVTTLPGYTSELGTYYIGVYTCYLYYDSDYAWSGSIITDDESTTYLNGVAVCQAPSCTSTQFTMNFKRGLNKLVIVHGEGGGGDGVTLSDLGAWKEYGAYATSVLNASMNHYSTTTQMNTAIEQKANQITQSVSQSYATKEEVNTIGVGGTNLLLHSSDYSDTSIWIRERAWTTSSKYRGTCIYTTDQSWADIGYNVNNLYDRGVIEPNTKYTFSCYVRSNNEAYQPNIHFFGHDNHSEQSAYVATASTTWKRISITFQWYDFSIRDYPIRLEATTSTPQSGCYLEWAGFKLEKGTKATDWTPAPEDSTESENKWLFEKYASDLAVNSSSSVYPTFDDIKPGCLLSSELVPHLSYLGDYGSTYLGKLTASFYFEADSTQTLTCTTDDNSSWYLNGQLVDTAYTCQPKQITFYFRKGWNKLTVLYLEGYGGDGVSVEGLSGYTKMNAYNMGNIDEYGIYLNNKLISNYATKSEVTQTATDLTVKFTESGGANLLHNGHAYRDQQGDIPYWINNGGSVFDIYGNAGGGVRGNFFALSMPNGMQYNDWIELKGNTHYVYQAQVWSGSPFTGNHIVPLHYWFSSNKSDIDGTGSVEFLDYNTTVSYAQTWTQVYIHFRTTADVYMKPFIYGMDSSLSPFYVTEIMLSESRVVQRYSPHPSEVYAGITRIDKDGIQVSQSNIATTTKMNASGFYIQKTDGTNVFKVDSGGLKMTGDIQGSTFSSANNIFQVLSDGTVETDDINVSGTVSTDTLTVNKISNPRYPEVLDKAMTVYIKNGASSPDEFYHGAVYGSFKDMLAVAPRNLQGYTLDIVMQSNITENVSLTWFTSGQVDISFQGYTLYGYLYCYGASMVYRLYGGNGDATKTGKIMPSCGRSMGSYYYALAFQYCQFAINNIGLYPDTTNTTNSGGICANRGARGNVFDATAYGSMRYLVRAEYGSHVYVGKTSGTCNNATFCATTGSIISINNDNTQAGRSTSGNPYWVGSGGMIVNNQLLGMANITFGTTANSGSNNNTSGTTSQTVTETITASLADTYRSTVYNNWKKDGTVRQGEWGYGNCTGLWFFDNKLSSALAKGTTKSVSIKITRQSGGNSGAVTHTLKVHNHATRPSGAPTMGSTITTFSLATGASTTLNLTSAQITTLKSGKGIGLQSSYSNSTYSVCSGTITIKVTYTT